MDGTLLCNIDILTRIQSTFEVSQLHITIIDIFKQAVCFLTLLSLKWMEHLVQCQCNVNIYDMKYEGKILRPKHIQSFCDV